jgi:Zn-dependent protease with chaperone function
MQNIYSLQNVLDTIATKTKNKMVQKRLIFDMAPVGGWGSKFWKVLFLILPFLLYGAIFNPWVFSQLGIAQAIIFFIVFLSVLMISIFTLASINNARVVKKITPSWQHYFPKIDLKLIVTSSATPYKDFFSKYNEAFKEDKRDEALYVFLKNAFIQMEEENKDLIEAMQNDRSK